MLKASNENIDSEALDWAAKRLYVQRESRKILFVLSDGTPACVHSNDHILRNALVRKINEVEKAGIEVIGIGILEDHVKNLYKNYQVIEDEKQIYSKIYKAMLTRLKN